MESALSPIPTATLLTLSKTLYPNFNRHFFTTRLIHTQLGRRRILNGIGGELRSFHRFTSITPSSVRSLSAAVVLPPVRRSKLQCVSSSAASFASGGGVGGTGGSSGGGSGGGGGGDGALDGGEEKGSFFVDVSESTDVIILDVGGMSCGGCVASVKRILESQPQVSSASVNLTTETAVVWPVSEAKVVPNWQKNLGIELAKHLTSCGFESNLRGEGSTDGDIPS